MNADQQTALSPFFLSWNLRNVSELSNGGLSGQPRIVSTKLGEYPIDAWKPFLIEVPRDGSKKDIVGRCNHASGASVANTRWNKMRTVMLPVYDDHHIRKIEQLALLVRFWTEMGIPDEVPCLAVAVRSNGRYAEDREVQCITVLLVWSDPVARIVSLDWTEGPLEDCITPEWFVESTPMLSLDAAVWMMRGLKENLGWEHRGHSIFTLPPCLGASLRGERQPTTYALWKREWAYKDWGRMTEDLEGLLGMVRSMFYGEGVRGQ